MATKDQPIKARLPRGFADRSAADIRATERMVTRIRRVYERYGFEPGETPLVEFTESLGKFLPDLDRPNEGVFSFRDEGDDDKSEWLSLRYDLTAPLARYVAENYERLPKPYRSYRFGWVFRNEKPGPGRFRQFMQFDADTVGASSAAADAEMCMMAADVLEELLGGPEEARGKYVIKVSSRKLLDGILQHNGISGERQRLAVLRAIDKLDRLGINAVRGLLGAGRTDASGDHTPGAGLSAAQVNRISEILVAIPSPRMPLAAPGGVPTTEMRMPGSEAPIESLNDSTIAWLAAMNEKMNGAISDAVRDLSAISDICRRSGYSDEIRIDPSVVRGLEYYTGTVLEAELLAQIPNEKGQPVVFGSVGGGGRYDGLVGRFIKDDVPAVGFSIGVSRLQAALSALGKLDDAGGGGPVVVLVMDKERVGDYQKMVADLRRADVPAELYLGSAGMKAQMKYADRRDAPLVVIQGGDEKAKGIVQIKDMRLGKQMSAEVADNAQWRGERVAQEEVAEADLVEAVNRMLGRGERRAP